MKQRSHVYFGGSQLFHKHLLVNCFPAICLLTTLAIFFYFTMELEYTYLGGVWDDEKFEALAENRKALIDLGWEHGLYGAQKASLLSC